MARFRLTNPLVTADSSVQQNFEGIQSYLNKLAPTVPVVTTLPTSPADGTVIDYIADSTNGVVWRFRYRAASGSAYKWEFVGGSPLRSTAGGTATTSDTLVSVSGPSITLPFDGDYRILFGFYGMLSGATNGGSAEGNARIGGTPVGYVARAGTDTNIGADGARFTTVAVTTGPHGGTASQVVDVWGRRNSAGAGGGTAFLNNMWLEVAPVRVG